MRLKDRSSEASRLETMATQGTLPNRLPATRRLITDHNEDGKAIFSEAHEDTLAWQDIGKIAKFALGYTTSQFPVN